LSDNDANESGEPEDDDDDLFADILAEGYSAAQDPPQIHIPCLGFKGVGDNVDENVKPSRQRYEIRSQSIHNFHSYVVKDRVPISSLSDAPPNFSTPDPKKLLPSSEDVVCVKKEMAVLLSR
jgi:hypothetical protein